MPICLSLPFLSVLHHALSSRIIGFYRWADPFCLDAVINV
jgi:hypothetical protein